MLSNAVSRSMSRLATHASRTSVMDERASRSICRSAPVRVLVLVRVLLRVSFLRVYARAQLSRRAAFWIVFSFPQSGCAVVLKLTSRLRKPGRSLAVCGIMTLYPGLTLGRSLNRRLWCVAIACTAPRTFAAQYSANEQFSRAIHTPVVDHVHAMVAVMHARVMLVAACSGAGPGTGSGCSDVRSKAHLQSRRQGLQPPSLSPGVCGHTQGIVLHPRVVSCLLAARFAARILVSRQQQHTHACVRMCTCTCLCVWCPASPAICGIRLRLTTRTHPFCNRRLLLLFQFSLTTCPLAIPLSLSSW